MARQPLKLTPVQREQRRFEAGQLLLTTTLSKAEIARRLGVSRSAVTQWAQQIKKRRRGLNSLRSRQHTGRPPRLTKANWRLLLTLLRHGAKAAGVRADQWTLARIQQVIQMVFGVSYSKSYLSDKLYDLGWPPQPTPKRTVRINPQLQLPPEYNNPYKRSYWRRR